MFERNYGLCTGILDLIGCMFQDLVELWIAVWASQIRTPLTEKLWVIPPY